MRAAGTATPIGADQATQPITEGDAEPAALLEQASPVVPALAVVHMSDSLDIIRSGIRPKSPCRYADTSGSLPDEEAARIRDGNLIYNSELQAHYIAGCIGWTIERGADAIQVRQAAFDDYMDRTGKKLDEFV